MLTAVIQTQLTLSACQATANLTLC